MNKIIIICISILILLLIIILFGVLGNHYVCKDNKCEYNYFTLNGLSATDCGNECKKSKELESDDDTQQIVKLPRYYFAKVNVNDKYNVLCLPTSLDSAGRNIIPFTNELATSFNSYESPEECENQKSFGNLYSVKDMYLLNSYYPTWRDYIYTNYNCGPQGCYYFNRRPWYWRGKRRWKNGYIKRRRRKKIKSFKISKK